MEWDFTGQDYLYFLIIALALVTGYIRERIVTQYISERKNHHVVKQSAR